MNDAPRALMRLAVQRVLHPEGALHTSWLPPDWPLRHRHVARLNAAGRAVLADLLDADGAIGQVASYRFDSRFSRVALLDTAATRRLAAYVGACAHKALLQPRGAGRALRRQVRRLDADADHFVIARAPLLDTLHLDPVPLQRRPCGTGRVMLDRGARLLLGALAGEDRRLVARVRRKLPRRLARHKLPVLSAAQVAQLQELALLCLIPERLAPWDWLF